MVAALDVGLGENSLDLTALSQIALVGEATTDAATGETAEVSIVGV